MTLLWAVSTLTQACLADPAAYFAARDYGEFSVTFTGTVKLDTDEPIAGAEVIQLLVEESQAKNGAPAPGKGAANACTKEMVDTGAGPGEDAGLVMDHDSDGQVGEQPAQEPDTGSYLPVPVYGARTLTDPTGQYSLHINLATPRETPQNLSFVLRVTHPDWGTQDRKFDGSNGATVPADFTLVSGTLTK